MRTRFVTASVMVACLVLAGGQALAQPRLPVFQSGDAIRANDLNRIVDQVRRNTSALDGVGGATHTVDCEAGETIANAMSQAHPGSTIVISGTCNEVVVVDKDGITLDGGGTAVIDGMDHDASVILVKGHQNVTIKGLTVQNGLIGVHVGLGAAAWIEDVTAKDSRQKAGHNSGFGILVANASDAVLAGAVVATGNGSDGIRVWQGGRASVVGNFVFEGGRMPPASLQANGNGGSGIEVGLGSSLQVHAVEGTYSTVQANDNGSRGIHLSNGSSAQFGGGASIEATGNPVAGLSIVIGSSAIFEGWWDTQGFTGTFNDNGHGIVVWNNASLNAYAGGTASNITATNNVTDGWGWGLLVDTGSSAVFESPSSDTDSKLVLSNNGHGAGVYSNSTLLLRMPAEIQDNAQDGISAWGNAFVDSGFGGAHTLINGNERDGISAWNGVGIYLDSDTVADNDNFDVNAGQGSRLDWGSNSRVDSVWCDGSALAFNDAACPEEAGEESDEGSGQ